MRNNANRTNKSVRHDAEESLSLQAHAPARLRCPDCGHERPCHSYPDAIANQSGLPCPSCNRMMAVAGGHA